VEQKICLDSDIIIEILKKTERGNEFLKEISDQEVFITSINVFELLLRTNNLAPVEALLSSVNILEFNETSARIASEIHKELKINGSPIDMRDLFIASVAIENNCHLATLNKKHFIGIKNLKLLN